ncbi:MAG: MATE family efflux transporter [Muricoprocola sp.]
MKNEEVLGKEKMWKLIARMTIPSILAQIVNLLYNIVDRMYIGNMPDIGRDALAGLGLCIPIITLISAFSSFVSGGGAPLASRALGANDKEKAHEILGNGTFLLLVFSVTLSLVAYIVKTPVLYLIGASEVTYGYANAYLSVYLIGTLFVQISVGLNTFLSAQGKSMHAMVSTMIGAVLNIFLDPLFIFVFNMGVKGAAFATIISQAVSAVWVLRVLTDSKTSLRLLPRYLKPKMKTIMSIFTLGIASFVMAATESMIGFVLNRRLKYYGGDIHVSTLAILQSVMMLISTPITGFTQGVTPILSYSFGAKNLARLKDCYYKTLAVSFSFCMVSALIMMLFPYPFVRMFTSDRELIALAVKYLPIFLAGMLIFGIQRACQTTFVAMGEAGISLFIAVLRKLILLIPFAYLFSYLFGVSGVYYAECVADMMSATICGTIFFFRFKKVLAGGTQ